MISKKWQKDLDPSSQAYIFASDENKTCRSLAGPGTGKTFSLMRKVVYLLEDKKKPEKILFITFTCAGAEDIQKELLKLEIEGVQKIKVSTLHSFCMGVLTQRDVIETNNRKPRPMLDYETKTLLYDINLDKKFGKDVRKCNKYLTDYEGAWARMQHDDPGYTQSEIDIEFSKRLNDWMEFHQAMTLGEIIPFTLDFIRDNPEHPSFHKYDYILVDEYQDLNKAEQVVIDGIANNRSLVIVGDDNQSIYSFKNAHPEGIREFLESHAPCNDIQMQECRRCPKKVVSIADSLIKHDSIYRGNDSPILLPFDSNGNGVVDIIQWKSYQEEARGIAQIAKKVLEENEGILRPEDILILNPSTEIVRLISDTLNDLGVPSQVIASNVKVILKSDEAKWLHALLTYYTNREDRVSLRYLLQKSRNFHKEQYKILKKLSEDQDNSPSEIIEKIINGEIQVDSFNANTAIIKRYKELQEIINSWEQVDNLEDFVSILITLGGENALEFIKRIISIQEDFEPEQSEEKISIQFSKKIVENILALATTADVIEDDKVRIMTYHSAKGLSGKLVFVSGCVDGLIPRLDEETTTSDIDEQRRLFYVALTRCKYTKDGYPGKLIISSFQHIQEGKKASLGIKVPYRGVHASRFLHNIDDRIKPQTQIGSEYLENL